MKILLLYLLLCFSAAVAAAGQDSAYYQHYNISVGLPSNNIYSVIQDHNGYIWFATDKGAVKYNGYTFQLFNASNGLPANDVYQLFEDNAGRMWVSTLTAHVGFIKEDVYHDLHFPEKMESVIYGKNFQSLGNDAGFCFVTPEGTYIVRAADTLVNLARYGDHDRQYMGNRYMVLVCFATGRILMIDSLDNLYMADCFVPWLPVRKMGKIRNGVRDPERRIPDRYMDGTHYFNYSKHVIYLLNSTIPEEKVIDIRSVNGDSTEVIYTADWDNGNFNVMSNKYVYLFNADGQLLRKTSNEILDSAQASYYKKDISGNEWYATARDAVFVHLNGPDRMHAAGLNVPATAKYMGTAANDCSFWWNGRSSSLLWLRDSTHAGRLQCRGNGNLASVSWFRDSVVALSFPDNTFLFNYVSGVLMPLLPQQYTFREKMYMAADRKIDAQSLFSPMRSHGFKKVLQHKDGSVLFFSAMGIYSLFSNADGSSVVEHIYNERFNDAVYEPVSEKYILYSTEKIAVLDADAGSIMSVTLHELGINGLNFISKMQTDHFGNVYILGNEDLFTFNPSAGFCFKQLKQPFSLYNSDIIVKDNRLFIAGWYGIAVASIYGKCSISDFSFTLNVKNRYYKQVQNLWVNHTNDIFLQTDQGYFTANADSIVADFGKYKNFDIGSSSWILKSPGQRKVRNGDTIIIPAENRKLAFDAINFLGSGAPTYSYRIKETDENWQTSASGDVLSDKIEPGGYYTIELRVKDDIWKNAVTTFYLYRPPYWYQTPGWKVIFFILGIITAGLAVTGVVSLIRQTTTRAREKKRILNELELRAIHAQINPHFIFNTLSTALYFINRKEYDNAYNHVNKFSYLLRSYLKSSHNRYVTLSEELEMLQRYIELQQSRFEEKFDYEFVIDNKVPAGNILIPSLLLQPLIENAINHGLFHKKGKGMLRICFEQGVDNTQLICTIDDDGVGRQESAQIKENNSTGRESYGSRLTEKLISVFRNYEDMGINMEYIDKEYPETGTIVHLYIENIKYLV